MKIMKKLIPFMLAFALLISCSAFGIAEAADDAAEAAALLENIKGTYAISFYVKTFDMRYFSQQPALCRISRQRDE